MCLVCLKRFQTPLDVLLSKSTLLISPPTEFQVRRAVFCVSGPAIKNLGEPAHLFRGVILVYVRGRAEAVDQEPIRPMPQPKHFSMNCPRRRRVHSQALIIVHKHLENVCMVGRMILLPGEDSASTGRSVLEKVSSSTNCFCSPTYIGNNV
jgi:hypothetical protein